MVVHYAEPTTEVATRMRHVAGLPTHGVCGHTILANNWTSLPDDVTCTGCVWVMLTTLQDQQSRLLKKIAQLAAKFSEETLKKANEEISGTPLGRVKK